MRRPLKQEIQTQQTADKAIRASRRAAYPPPPYVAAMLQERGVSVTRQLITRRYKAAGIEWDPTTGLWVAKKKGQE